MTVQKITAQQAKELSELHVWFAGEIKKLQQKQLDIMRRYEQKVSKYKMAVVKKRVEKM